MGLMLIGTVIMFGMVIYCILFQINIIIKQQENTRLHEDFSYAMVHDMKTPLSSIITCERMLHSGRLDDKPEMRNKYHSIVESEADHLLSLANKILNLSKLENHKLILNKCEVVLQPIVDALEETFTAKSTKPVSFTSDIKAKEVFADGEFIKEALSNLIDNAIKYSKAEIEIDISSYLEDDYTVIKVRDNGIGISEKDQQTIFNKFERASAVKRTAKGGPTGFGLGLNYVYQVTLAHNGKVHVNSKEGEFSEFILYLPIEKGKTES
jgi:two-component system phosphate regulon sensor histidine kinase PhoR